MGYKSLQELGNEVDAETIVVTTLGELRSAIGYERLGRYVLGEMSSSLEGEGLGYFPLDVIDANAEPRQGEQVRIYRRGTGVGRLIQAVTTPTPSGDRTLREQSGNDSDVVKQIRALVCI